MNIYERALALSRETVEHRRWFHSNPEVGLSMPGAVEYVTAILKEYGLEPRPCGHGVTATLGRGGKCLLLRADMDALPMAEESGEPFAAKTGGAHACGHDFHAAMLLTAAKILKEQESSLKGTVKFMFQPGEEIFQGSRDMMDAGILENPRVDGAMAVHVAAGHAPVGSYLYNSTGVMMCSADGFRVTVTGKGGHGAYPHTAVDPVHIAVRIYQALEGLVVRETDPARTCVITVGHFQAGTAPNILPDQAVLEGTIRTDDPDSRALLVRRVEELAEKTGESWGGSVRVEWLSGVPSLRCDPALTEEMVGYLEELNIPGTQGLPGIRTGASEDFAWIANRVPSVFLYLSAGFPDARGDAPAHNPRVRFNEEVCPIGAAVLAHCAQRWLETHGK